jgi:glycosyltransferase involved in cell wall biosynthesis
MSLHIVVVAPPWYPVPPKGYGGIESIVALLTAELRRRGNTVTMFAAEGSPGSLERAPRAWRDDLGTLDERVREATYAARVSREIAELGPVDIIHDHNGFITPLALSTRDLAPVIHTVHGALAEPEHSFYAEIDRHVGLVAISRNQRQSAPHLRWAGVVHNAVDVDALWFGDRDDKRDYLLCLARICPDKGQLAAIEAARRAGIRLVLAGKIEPTPRSLEYYERHIAPAIDGDAVTHVHNVSGAEKADLIARAKALLAPIQWDEPFGLSIVEAMVSGTPAISIARGAAPELIADGVSGFLVEDVDGMVGAIAAVDELDPQECAREARRRFSPAAMADGYLAVYDRVLAGVRAA